MARPRLVPFLSADQIQTRVSEMGRAIAADFPQAPGRPPLCLVAALKGAYVFLADLARAVPRDVRIDFMRAKSYGDGSESSGRVKILLEADAEIAGANVILVEDILDTGRTAAVLLARLRARKPNSLRVAALLDKPSRRIAEVRADYVGFTIPDRFVVGYGMDHAERYRNLPDVRFLEENC